MFFGFQEKMALQRELDERLAAERETDKRDLQAALQCAQSDWDALAREREQFEKDKLCVSATEPRSGRLGLASRVSTGPGLGLWCHDERRLVT